MSTESPAFVLCWSASEPDRIGESARLLPGDYRIGHVARTDAAPLAFAAERPGTVDDSRPLLSGHPGGLSIHTGIFGARIRTDDRRAYVNGARLPLGEWRDLAPGDTLYLRDDVLLHFTMRRSLPALVHFPPWAVGAFGEPDALDIVGESEVVWRWREEIAAAASSAQHVLVHGENGTGKEPTAWGIHALSARSDGFCFCDVMTHNWDLPFWVFGHAEDARGIPEPPRRGIIGKLDGGTLVVDHVQLACAQMGVEAIDQVLSSGGAYCRVGDPTPRLSKFVLVVVVRGDPEAVPPLLLKHVRRRIRTPTLAEHPEDIPLLMRTLIRRSIADGTPLWKDVPWFDASGRFVPDPRAVDRLVRHDYQDGNMWYFRRQLGEEGYRATIPQRASGPIRR